MKAVGIIPARFHSTRLPGKPLVPIAGKSLIQRVYENASQCQRLAELIVATDDERIQKEVQNFGGQAVMTPSALPSGTDRCAFVAKTLDADIIANIQGDEPFLDVRVLDRAIKLLSDVPDINVITAAKVGISAAELNNPNVVKVLIDRNQDALLFSRQSIPYIRNHAALSAHPAMQHIGIYVFRQSYLQKFVEMPQTLLEQLEQLEQLRILENGDKIRVVLTDKFSLGIDTLDDVKHAERILKSNEA
ncbi:3-deoxy-manno-octulosonate cytidylyltransferase [bacterium]|nr:3-deoxy-manno-octulosonate cytidylyltransferase [bacterium]MBU1872877.1 3-deoxy-manno-octulosonate cytidylyltransferase [bacterium]